MGVVGGGVKLTWRGSEGEGGGGGRTGFAVVKLGLEFEVWEGEGRGAPVGAWVGWVVVGGEDGRVFEVEGEEEVEENGQGAMAIMLVGSCGVMARLSYGLVERVVGGARGVMLFMMTSLALLRAWQYFIDHFEPFALRALISIERSGRI